jgi:ParB-like chromosome segregation protein Spo0J
MSKSTKAVEIMSSPELDPAAPTNEAAAEWAHIDDLDPLEKNPRKNDDAAPRLAKVIVKLGFGTALLAWLDPSTGRRRILGGHTRKKAVQIIMRQLPNCSAKQRAKWHSDAIRTAETGMVPVRVRADLTREQAIQLSLVDNKSNEWAEWDEEMLVDVLSEFSLPDVEDLGFSAKELDKLADDVYGLGEVKDEKQVKLDTSFQVVITVGSEDEQLSVIEWAQDNGYKCRALI